MEVPRKRLSSGKRAAADEAAIDDITPCLTGPDEKPEVASGVSSRKRHCRTAKTSSTNAIVSAAERDTDGNNGVKKVLHATHLSPQQEQPASPARVTSRSGRVIRPVADRYPAAMTATRKVVPKPADQRRSAHPVGRHDDDALLCKSHGKSCARQPTSASASRAALEVLHRRIETIRAGLSALVAARETALVEMASREVESSEEWEVGLQAVDESWREGRRKAVVRWILGREKTAREMEARQVERGWEEGRVRSMYMESVGIITDQMMLHAKLELMNAVWRRKDRGSPKENWLGMGHNSRRTILRLLQKGQGKYARRAKKLNHDGKTMTKEEMLIAINTEARRKKKRLWKMADLEERDRSWEGENEEAKRQRVDDWYIAVDRMWDDWCLRMDAATPQSKKKVLPRKVEDIVG